MKEVFNPITHGYFDQQEDIGPQKTNSTDLSVAPKTRVFGHLVKVKKYHSSLLTPSGSKRIVNPEIIFNNIKTIHKY